MRPYWSIALATGGLLLCGCGGGRSVLETEPYAQCVRDIQNARKFARAQDAAEKALLQAWPRSKDAVVAMIYSDAPELQESGLQVLFSMLRSRVEGAIPPQNKIEGEIPDPDTEEKRLTKLYMQKYAQPGENEGLPDDLPKRLWELRRKSQTKRTYDGSLVLLLRYDRERALAECQRVVLERSRIPTSDFNEVTDAIRVLDALMPDEEKERFFVELLESKKLSPPAHWEQCSKYESQLLEPLIEMKSRRVIPYLVRCLEERDMVPVLMERRQQVLRYIHHTAGILFYGQDGANIDNYDPAARVAAWAIKAWFEENKEQLLDKTKPLPPFEMPTLPEPKSEQQ